MVEKMKKLSLLILHSSKDKFLSSLQDLGVVHIEADKSIQTDEINTTREKINRLEKNLSYLQNFKDNQKLKTKNIKTQCSDDEFNSIIESIEHTKGELDSIASQIDQLQKEIDQLAIWGVFDSENITRVEDIGLQIKFYSTPKGKFQKSIEDYTLLK